MDAIDEKEFYIAEIPEKIGIERKDLEL